jgi:hypothetical protein
MGISLVVIVVFAFLGKLSLRARIFFLAIVATGLLIVASTDSIQGLVAFTFGLGILGFFLAKRWGIWFIRVYALFVFFGFISLVMALFDKGPLKSLIYQVTILYRADYMHAGLKMMLNHPLTGVGIDSYDDWYRTERGVISAFRSGLNRTANTSHNIALDLGAGGGFPLLIAYLLLNLLVLSGIVKSLKKGHGADPIFVAALCAWAGYQVQASVSINQIGVGIWGWIISGILIGYSKMEISIKNTLREKDTESLKKNSINLPPPSAVIVSAVLGCIAFAIAFLPFKADMDFRGASRKGDLSGMMKATSQLASNAFLISQANNSAMAGNFQDQAKEINDRLTGKFPRNFYGWSVRASLPNVSELDRQYALNKLMELDPYQSLCLSELYVPIITEKLTKLPSSKQYELAKGWGLVSTTLGTHARFSLTEVNPEILKQRIAQFCG